MKGLYLYLYLSVFEALAVERCPTKMSICTGQEIPDWGFLLAIVVLLFMLFMQLARSTLVDP